MELALQPLVDAFLGMLNDGNLGGAALILVLIFGVMIWRKLNNLEKTQKKKKTNYNNLIVEDSRISDELDKIRRDYSADRAVILELRNGEANLADIPAMKVYVKAERLRPNTFSVSGVINGIPASFYSTALKDLVQGRPYILTQTEELKEHDFGLYQNLIQLNVKSLYAMPLIDDRGVLYGALLLEYCITEHALEEREARLLSLATAKLNGEILATKSF